MYNHEHQYRCTIIRGKSQKEIDDLLPAYASIISDICPCNKDDFAQAFNDRLAKYVSGGKEKSLDNHRTEIAGKLFGMYYPSSQDDDAIIYPSERTLKFLADNDQPAFFKDVCYKMQFPNGMAKAANVAPLCNIGISIRQYCFVLRLLQLARKARITLTKSDIGYYALNNLDVLQGKSNPDEVMTQITKDRKDGIERKVHTDGKKASYDVQHINEQLNLLELANLIYIDERDKFVTLNSREEETIELFASKWNEEPMFNAYDFDLSTTQGRKAFSQSWDEYYGKISDISDKFTTSASALSAMNKNDTAAKSSQAEQEQTTTELGDEGEEYVYKFERERVAKFNSRLVGKVISLGKQKGLGYDIQSVIAEEGDEAEFVKYIEVKATKRVTAPDINNALWLDTLNMTQNEYVAAKQHKDYYAIYRVYFTRDGVVVFILNNISKKIQDKTISVVPTMYRVDFSNNSVDFIIATDREVHKCIM